MTSDACNPIVYQVEWRPVDQLSAEVVTRIEVDLQDRIDTGTTFFLERHIVFPGWHLIWRESSDQIRSWFHERFKGQLTL